MSIPVVIAENGHGLPVRAVEADAPVLTVAGNGLGAPVVISERGAPFVIEGLGPSGQAQMLADDAGGIAQPMTWDDEAGVSQPMMWDVDQ